MSFSASGAGPTRQQIAPLDPVLRERDQRLEALKAVVGRLAHDFNNALVPILGYLSMAREDLEPESGAANFVAAAEGGARKTERNLDAILLAVYPHRKFKAGAASLNELIQKEVEAWKGTLASEPKIEFSVSLTSFTRDLDVFQWQTLIQLLLRNACKALPNGGRVQMSLIRRSLDESGAAEIGVKPGPFGVMTCQDDGCGMSAETLSRCCEPFFSTQPKNKAAGLGLTTVHSIARLHGGQLRIRSEEGKGTTVEIWAPAELMPDTAFITGITGQDGSYLTELLLGKGYEVHGMVRRTSAISRSRLQHLYADAEIYGKRLFLHYAELDDPTTVRRLLSRIAPGEIYHLAGQSHVGLSFEIAESTCEMTAMGTLRLLEILRDLPSPPKFFHASTSEIFGRPKTAPQDENTPFAPVNPYGCAKAFASRMVSIYREVYGMFACNGIMFNHESPRRGENFVTRKICRAAAAIKLGLEKDLALGDVEAERDWGDARDVVRGMWMVLRHPAAEDFVFATGRVHTVRDVARIAFETVGLDWRERVRVDPRFLRPAEPSRLVGNAGKAEKLLDWRPANTFENLIREMTEGELARLSGPATPD